jgi:hypothetical protein
MYIPIYLVYAASEAQPDNLSNPAMEFESENVG